MLTGQVVGHGEPARVQVGPGRCRVGNEQPPDLGRDGELLARMLGERSTEPPFGQPQTVVWCGVEVADPAVPRGLDGSASGAVIDGRIEVGDGGGTEAQTRDLDLGACQRTGFHVSPYQRVAVPPNTSALSSGNSFAVSSAVASTTSPYVPASRQTGQSEPNMIRCGPNESSSTSV